MGRTSNFTVAVVLIAIVVLSCLNLLMIQTVNAQTASQYGTKVNLQIVNFSAIETDESTYHQYYNSTSKSNMVTIAYNPNFYQRYHNISKHDYYSDTFALAHYMGNQDFTYFNVTVVNNSTFPVNNLILSGQITKQGSITLQENWYALNDYVIQPGDTFLFPVKSTQYPSSAYATGSVANNSENQTPTPSVPELSWLVILPLFLSILCIVVLIRKGKFGDCND